MMPHHQNLDEIKTLEIIFFTLARSSHIYLDLFFRKLLVLCCLVLDMEINNVNNSSF